MNNISAEVNSDNRNVSYILKVGSMKKALQDITMSVHSLCEEKSIHLNCIWLISSPCLNDVIVNEYHLFL